MLIIDSPYLYEKSIATVYLDGTFGPCLRNHSFNTDFDRAGGRRWKYLLSGPGI